MTKRVLKRNREKERCDDDKIRGSIEAAAKEAGYTGDTVKQVIETVMPSVDEMRKNRDAVKTSEIREAILRRLDERFPEASAAWRNFDKVKSSM